MSAPFTIGKNKILTIRSFDRVSGTPSNFVVNLSQFNLNPSYVSFHQVAIPNGFFNVNSQSNTLSLTAYNSVTTTNSTTGATSTTVTPYAISVTVTPGNYTTGTGANSLLVALLNQLNTALVAACPTASSSVFSAVVNSYTGYVTLNVSSGWMFQINPLQSLDWLIGYRPNVQSFTQTNSFTGAAIMDLRSPPRIYIRCTLVAGNYLSPDGASSVLCTVQNTALFSQTVFQRAPTAELDIFAVSGAVAQVHIQLTDEWGQELTMDTNQDWELSVGFYNM